MSAIVQERSGVSLQRLAPGQDNRVGPMAGLPPARQRPEKLYLKLWWKKTDKEGVQTIESETIHVDEEVCTSLMMTLCLAQWFHTCCGRFRKGLRLHDQLLCADTLVTAFIWLFRGHLAYTAVV
jgi:hypothetical protein